MTNLTFHSEMNLHFEAVPIPTIVLNKDILDYINSVKEKYSLLKENELYGLSNGFYFFIYVKDIKGNFHRIDYQLP